MDSERRHYDRRFRCRQRISSAQSARHEPGTFPAASRDEDALKIVAVALDWQSVDEVKQYAERHELNVPVLLGDAAIARNWKVYGFPTYYVLDSESRVVSRDIGYSTQLGLLWRSWVID